MKIKEELNEELHKLDNKQLKDLSLMHWESMKRIDLLIAYRKEFHNGD